MFSFFLNDIEFLAFKKMWALGYTPTIYAHCLIGIHSAQPAKLQAGTVQMRLSTFKAGMHV